MNSKPPSLKSFSSDKQPAYRWAVWYPEGGKRKRRLFRSKSEASDFLNRKNVEFRNLGTEYASALSDELQRQAVDASRELAEVNATIPEAVEFYLKHVGARKRSKPLAEAVEEWLKIRRNDGTRPRTLGNLESRSGRFVEAFAGRLVAEIGTEDVVNYLETVEGTQQTRKHHRAVASAFFRWAKLRGLTDRNPVEDVPIPKVEQGDPEVFTPKQMEDMVRATEGDPQLVAWLVLCGFAGLRAEEAERLDWSDIDFDHKAIDIRPAVSKTRQGRDVELEDNAIQWLRPIARDKGRILQLQFAAKQKVRNFKAGLGFDWPGNGLRHSYGTYHLYRGMDAGKTAMMMGHNGNPQMLFRHYRKRVKQDVARKWFEVRPPKTKGKIVAMTG